MKCPICGQEASFIQDYNRHYCYNCKKYLPPPPVDQPQKTMTEEPLSSTRIAINSYKLLFKNPQLLILPAVSLTITLVLAFTLNFTLTDLFTSVQANITVGANPLALFSEVFEGILLQAIIVSVTQGLLGYLVVSVTIIETKRLLNGEPINLKQSISDSFSKLINYFLVILITVLIIGLGFILLVIPGLLLFISSVFIMQVIFLEDLPVIDSVKYALKTGYKNLGKIIGFNFVFFLINLAILLPLGLVTNLEGFELIGSIIEESFLQLILLPVFFISVTMLYLKGVKRESLEKIKEPTVKLNNST